MGYRYLLDLDKDGTFDHVEGDITDFVISASLSLGTNDIFSNMGTPANAKITVNNAGKEFSPESATALTGIGGNIGLRVEYNSSDTTRDATAPTGYFDTGATGIGDGLDAIAINSTGSTEPPTNFFTFGSGVLSDFGNKKGTISFWIYPLYNTSSSHVDIVEAYFTDITRFYIRHWYESSTYKIEAVFQDLTLTEYAVQGDLVSGEWNNVVIRWGYNVANPNEDTSSVEIYINGVLSDTADINISGTQQTGNRFRLYSYGTHLTRLAHFAIWDTPLPEEYPLVIYNNVLDQTVTILDLYKSNLIAYHRFNDTSTAGGTLTSSDYSRNTILFTGVIPYNGIQVQPLVNNGDAYLTAKGSFYTVLNEETKTGWLDNYTADAVVQAILGGSEIVVPLRDNTIDAYLVALTGSMTYPYSGDQWRKGGKVSQALKEVATAEQGFIYEKRSGHVGFYSRKFWNSAVIQGESAFYFDDSHLIRGMGNTTYTWGEYIINRVTVPVYPRDVATSLEIVGRLRESPPLLPGKTTIIDVEYSDKDNNVVKIGAKDCVFVKNAEWKANTEPDASGIDATDAITLESFDNKGTLGRIIVTNDIISAIGKSITLYLTHGSSDPNHVVIRGKGIRQYEEIPIVYEDTTSIDTYGLHEIEIQSSLMGDTGDALAIAQLLVNEWSTPRGLFKQVSVLVSSFSGETLNSLLSLTIGNRVTVTEEQTGHSGSYYIIGENHTISAGGMVHLITYTLRPTTAHTFWLAGITGYSNAGTTTYAGLG